jgi:predicted lipoprotein with Yx(FWY)xxD motif
MNLLMNNRKLLVFITLMALVVSAFAYSASAMAAEEGMGPVIHTDAEVAGSLGLLLGDGDGLTEAYLSKSSTRMQAAIIFLRLQGLLEEAMAFEGEANFSDEALVGEKNKMVLAYLKAHPALGWQGMGDGAFDPLAPISAQQLYKVMLESLGYRSGTDFMYAETEAFAAGKGLSQIAGTSELQNAHIATALVESLTAMSAGGETLFSELQAEGMISATAMLPEGTRISLAVHETMGTYVTDGNGRTLYVFTKDAEDLNACQGKCLENWPVFYDEHLQIPASMNKADFDVLVRANGTKQLTYQGWPMYYFIKDAASGDVNGEAANGVWFVAKMDYAVMIGTSTELGHYLTDAAGNTLYYFDKDTEGMSMCEGKCLANWPAFVDTGAVPSTLDAADFSSITRSDGSLQTTYKGFPLYYFIKDEARGDTLGQDVNQVWFVVNPDSFSGTTAAQVKTYQVDIKQFSFGSEPLTVEAGSKIVFTNLDAMEHNAVAVNGTFSTPLLKQGESATIQLNEAGTYEYFCEPHKKFMTGTIIVK